MARDYDDYEAEEGEDEDNDYGDGGGEQLLDDYDYAEEEDDNEYYGGGHGGKARKRGRSELIDDMAEEDDEEEDEEDNYGSKRNKKKSRGASQFFEIEAEDAEDDEEEEDGGEDDFIDDVGPDIQGEEDDFRRMSRRNLLPRDDEQEDIEALENEIQRRYARSSHAEYDEEATDVEQQALLPSVRDPKLWMVKCAIGREREVAVCLMQKFIDKGSELQIRSVTALDHLKNYIYIEADKEAHVREAIKGMRSIFGAKITLVPIKEMTDVLSVESKAIDVSRDTWVRMKSGTYKGDLAKVVDVDNVRQRVTVKLIPRIDLQALQSKLEGKEVPKKAFVPPPRFMNIDEARELHIRVERRRDPMTGDYFESINGMLFKDGFLYKTVSMKTIRTQGIQPTFDELEKFRQPADSDGDIASLSTLFANRKKGHFLKGDAVIVIKGDLKNLKGWVEKVEEGQVHIRPNEKGLPKTLAINEKEICKYFEPGNHVKVASGTHEGATGMVLKVEGHVLIILSDTTREHIRVFADHVVESSEVTTGITRIGDYEIHDLVILDNKSFGVVIRVETEAFQVLKGVPDRPEVVLVRLREIKSKVDKKMFALDRSRNTISVKDVVRVLDGPCKGKQGPVEHIFRGVLFIYDRHHLEHAGFICAKSNSCLLVGGSRSNRDKIGDPLSYMRTPQRIPQSPGRLPPRGPPMNTGGRHRGGRGHDSLIGITVKIRTGPYKGYRGRVKEVKGMTVRVELESQMKEVTVDRSAISDNVAVSTPHRDTPRYGMGSETPMHPSRTPMHPFMTPMRDPGATPIHDGMRTPMRDRAWNPYAPMSPPRIFMMSEELSSVSSKRKRSYKTVSFVWEHFTQIKQGESTVITSAQCNYCKQEFKWKKSDGTSTLTRHLDRCRSYPYNEVNRGDTTYELNDLDINIKNWKFDQELLRKELARMIIVDELPFCFVEKEGFRRFCKMMQPRFRMVSRATVTRDCIQIYNEEKESLKLALQQASSQVCLTTDLWTSIQNLGYMCLTVHFIDKEWRLNKKIVNFCVLPTPHRGENIAKAVDDCLLSWGLDKVCTLTVDNASSNDTAIYHLKERLNSRNLLLLKGDFLHVRCFAHILNLMVKDGINMIAEGINIIRNCVKYIRSSPSRLQCFKKCAARERDVSKKTLCLDVSTRWNSTYMMIEAVLENQKALVSMSYEDTNLSFLRDIDWNVLKSLHKFLEHFYHVTKRISGSKYVTSNMFFKEVNTIMSILKKWCSSVNPAFQKMAKTMKEKFEKYCDLEKVNVMLFMAVVLDPRYKLMYLEFRFNKFYHEEKVGRLMKKVNDTLHRLFDDYSSSLSLLCSSGASSNSMSQVLPSVDIEGIPNVEEVISESQEDWQLFLQDLEKKKSKSELQRYLDDRVEADKSDFNILQWWMSNGSTYPVLSVIARDILSIQISTVASESAFSTGGRILDPFRSCLTPKIVEALVCGQDWLRSSSVPVDIEESLEALEELEIGNFQDAQFGSSSP